MKQIEAHQVKRDNSNIRSYSDELWRALRQERFKPAKPDPLTNQMAAEAFAIDHANNVDFYNDINKFIDAKLKPKEAIIFRLFLFGGRMTQAAIAEHLGVCQATVALTLRLVLNLVKEEFYGCK